MADTKAGDSRKTKGIWKTDNMHRAVEKVFQQLHWTIRVCDVKYRKEIPFEPMLGGFRRTFPAKYEEVLVDHLEDLTIRPMSLNKKEFFDSAHELAESLKLPHQFNKDKQSGGKHFYHEFTRRLVVEDTRSNKPQIGRFLNCLPSSRHQCYWIQTHEPLSLQQKCFWWHLHFLTSNRCFCKHCSIKSVNGSTINLPSICSLINGSAISFSSIRPWNDVPTFNLSSLINGSSFNCSSIGSSIKDSTFNS